MQSEFPQTNNNGVHVAPVVRFAPSPNGYLHLGHAYSALRNYEFARRHGGRFLLRIEDIDMGRARPEFEQAIYEDLAWLGIEWETPVLRQSEYFGAYAIALEKLNALGLLYSCTCTRNEILEEVKLREEWPRDPDGAPIYPGTCRDASASSLLRQITSDKPVAQRLNMTQAIGALQGPVGWIEYGEQEDGRSVSAQPSIWGDVVVGRKDVPGSYHIAVVVDDAEQGVTDVIRGMDLFEATSLHRLLQELLNLPAPVYHHHRLITDEHERKLSKSAGSPALRDLRAQGVTVADIRAQLELS